MKIDQHRVESKAETIFLREKLRKAETGFFINYGSSSVNDLTMVFFV
jgi:hypothetical protein